MLQKLVLNSRRQQAIRSFERRRSSRLITLIHRQESVSFLGVPIARYIDIEDSEQVLRAIRLTDDDVPIDVILHTPGGLVLAAEQIACALARHKAPVTVFIPHYAMSGGTLIALAADEIVMDPNAVVGPVDPQIGDPQRGTFAAASILAALQQPNPNRDDSTLILGDIAEKAIRQVNQAVFDLIRDKMTAEKARELADLLSQGTWTHDYPINADQARDLGLPVRETMPVDVYSLMDLYPQTQQRRPSVEFVPVPYRPSAPLPPGRDRQ
ncbi:MAG: S49 family peptidase [Chloroflexi bacterium]|nr:S49 family peptidase [Chloroflexota bacterium]MCL5109668.1 S49 family peptidase [Chloroflexota bacterium]